jgi:hypothetical protein
VLTPLHVAVSHSFTSLSSPAEASQRPSGENAAHLQCIVKPTPVKHKSITQILALSNT